MPYSVSPYWYLRRYTDGVPVWLGSDNGDLTLLPTVWRYRNNSLSGAKFGCDNWPKRAGAIKNAIKAAVKKAGGNSEGERFPIPPACGDLHYCFMDRFYDWSKIVHVHTGKGSPQEISEVMSAAVVTGVIHPDSIYEYIDDHVGLDCNGFVGNWAAQNHIKVAGSKASANLSLRYYASRNQDKKRRSIDEIRQGDVLVWVTDPHIAAVEMVCDKSERVFIVCESSASLGGLRASFYRLTSIRKEMENFTKENRLLSSGLRKEMKADMKDGKANKSSDWYEEADALGKAYKVHSYDRGTDMFVSIHGLTNQST